jgi:hypothetical protein
MWILLYGPRDNHSFLVLREIIPTLRETAFYVLMWASWSGRYRSARHLFLLTNLYCMNIFVGRLNHSITPLHLELLFGHFGEVERVNLIKDRETGEFRKFGFVQMKDAHDAQIAISKLDGARLEGASILVKPANERARA